MHDRPVSVMLADDQDLVRIGLRALLDNEPGMTVVAEAADGLGAVREAQRTRPDVILMDIRMPGIDGIEAARRIADDDTLTDTRVIVLTTFDHDTYVFDALRHGASGFLLKNAPPETLLAAIRTVAGGGAMLTPSVTRSLIREFVSVSPRACNPHPRLEDLTGREREIAGLVAQGMSNDEIAAELVVSPATVRTHVSRAMLKLSARDRAQLVVFAFQSGLA